MSINSEAIQTVPWLMQVLASLRGQSVWDLRWTKFPLFMNLFLFCLQVYLNTKDSGRGGVFFTDIFNCQDHIMVLIEEPEMNSGHCWTDTDSTQPKYTDTDLS